MNTRAVLITILASCLAAAQVVPAGSSPVVDELTTELSDSVLEAGKSWSQFTHIAMDSSSFTPKVFASEKGVSIDQAVEAAKNPSTFATDRNITKRIDFYKGSVENTFRAEYSPIIRYRVNNGAEEEAQTGIPKIVFKQEDGKTFVRTFNYGIGDNGDILESNIIVEDHAAFSRFEDIMRGTYYGPDTVLTNRGIPLDGFLRTALGSASDAIKTQTDNGFRYTFSKTIDQKNVEYVITLKRFAVDQVLPLEYQVLNDGVVGEIETWDYAEAEGIVVPTKSTHVYQSLLPDQQTTVVVNFEFDNTLGALSIDQVKAPRPVGSIMNEDYAHGRQIVMDQAAANTGIALSGKIVDPMMSK